MIRQINVILNGKSRSLAVDARQSLLEVLREQEGIMSVKAGCGVGECGACAVLIDDVLFDACIYMAVWADGKTIRTVEEQCRDGQLSPIQQAYVDEGAVQCGFCTPGFIMASTAFLESKPGPDVGRDAIRKAHAGNLCRCTGYGRIVAAVEKCCQEQECE